VWNRIDELPEVAQRGARFEPRDQDRDRAATQYRRWRDICDSVAHWASHWA
jgi:hypothetical protein